MKIRSDVSEKLSKLSSTKSQNFPILAKFDQRQLTLIRTSKNIDQNFDRSNKIIFFSILNIMKLPLK